MPCVNACMNTACTRELPPCILTHPHVYPPNVAMKNDVLAGVLGAEEPITGP